MTAAFDRFGQNQTLWSPSQQPPSDRSKLLGPQQLRQATRSIEAASTQPIAAQSGCLPHNVGLLGPGLRMAPFGYLNEGARAPAKIAFQLPFALGEEKGPELVACP